jgi:type III restriction enzyme
MAVVRPVVWQEDLVEFLMQKENKSKEQIEEKVLIITSHKDHKSNLLKLKTVDSKENKTEWIISVSMLSEGWGTVCTES